MKKAFLLLVFISIMLQAQPDILWTKTFGGANNDFANIVQQTIDGGFIIGGSTQSFGSGQSDIWLIKTDENGDSLWSTTLGNNNSEGGGFVQQTQDGGYIVAGTIRDSINNYSVSNIWLIKTDENGDSLWSNIYGGSDLDHCTSIQQTQDGGYIIGGLTSSYASGQGNDVLMIKTDANGDSIWSNTYGGLNNESSAIVQQTQDGGYLIGATTKSYGEGGDDMWLIKTNGLGDTLWTKTIGSAENERTKDIIESTDGGYIIIGTIPHFDWGMQSMIGMYKFNEYGESVEWNWTLGFGISSAGKIESTQDDGYIILGYTPMQLGNTPFLSKLNSNGFENWSKILEGNLNTVKQTNSGDYISTGYVGNGFEVPTDIILMKLGHTGGSVLHVSTTGSDETGDGSGASPYATIQKAVNFASNGDTILVMNGLYIENIDWSITNNICLIGSHIDSTIIDGGNNGKVIDNSDETSHPIEISNLTIQNGISTGKGGGISLKMVGDLLLKNIRVNNNNAQIGGGIYIEGEGSESFIPTVVHFENAIISNNSAENYGGGVSLSGDVISSIIKNVTVVNNFATNGGGGIQSGSLGDYAIIVNSIFWNNQPTNVDGMVFPYYSNIDIPVGSNNIYTDPLFVNDSTNFNLLDGSPCIDGGTEFLVVDLSTYMLPGTVPDTIININDGDYYGLAPDMGAIEYQSILHLDRDLLPKQYILHQNYPNPFNPVTSLRYDLPEDGLVNITIYDMIGRIVKTLVNSSQAAGYKSIKWNATNDRNEPVSAGLYLYTIQAGEFRQTKKMVLLK